MTCSLCEQIAEAEGDRDVPYPCGACSCSADMVEIAHYRPEALRAKPQRSTRLTLEVDGVVGCLTRPTIGPLKDAAGAWSPGICRGDERADANVERVTLLAYDVDDCREGDVERSATILSTWLAVVHTTFSATVDKPKHRVVLFLSRALAPAEHRLAWPFGALILERAGVHVDPACKDLARIYYSPVVRPGHLWRARVCRGRPIDVDRMIAAATPTKSAPVAPPRAQHRTHTAASYAHKALERAAGVVAMAGEGERNSTLNRETHSIARLPDLADTEIESAMLTAATRAGLPEHEARRTIASALGARRRSA